MYMTQPDRQRIQHIRDYCEEIREIIWETAVNDIPALKQFCRGTACRKLRIKRY